MPEAGAEPFPGYCLVRLRGRGAFATVWESTTPTGQMVALKFMSSANAHSTSREIHSLQGIQRIRHPYLLEIHNVRSMPGYIVIGMDLAEASLLDLFLLYQDEFNSLIEPEKVLQYLSQAAGALDYLNARRHAFDGKTVGFQHSDIKPNNILLLGNEAKLADYGLATPMNGPTTPCFRQGTLDYAAPEVFLGSMSDSSDQFSLAVTYHLLRTGAFPFPPPPQQPGRSFHRPPPHVILDSSDEYRAVMRALSTSPQDRFPTCSAFIDAVAAANNIELARDRQQQTVTAKRRTSTAVLFQATTRVPAGTPPLI
ncbi:protein kinase domain-containing protein [Limnoglobus roseus]|uniref:protein kinase domain-containing protein n=1 Tax=Limnoglobus roseus TaxID=2598579 RepID=UPI00143DA8A0|nr:protein kinase [Limnoglobus roseus]